MGPIERIQLSDQAGAVLGHHAGIAERLGLTGCFEFECYAPDDHDLPEYLRLRDRLAGIEGLARLDPRRLFKIREAAALRRELDAVPVKRVWSAKAPNTVVTVGKNHILDNALAGSAFTAANYLGLISSTSYSAIAAGDTMSSHAGWLEAGSANAPTYSQGARPTAAWSSASAGSKALSASLTFSITGTGTVKGAFLTTNSTKDGTTGTLISAGLFSGGDQPVVNGNSLAVSYSMAA